MQVPALKGLQGWLKLHYDKLIAIVVLVGLCASLLYLAIRIGTIQSAYEAFTGEIDSFKPKYPAAQPVDPAPYRVAMASIDDPAQIPAWSNAVFVPDGRVWCVDCRMPIPWSAMECPFCRARQPRIRETDPLYDADGDGIPNLWEKKFGLDPADPDDVNRDNDGDGFINIVEFRADPQTDLLDLNAKHGTDMNDPHDFPPPERMLFVREITGTPFELVFKARITLPDGSLKFQLNLRKNARTVWAKMDETVEGFTVTGYEERMVKRERGGMLWNVDESILTVSRGGKKIQLQKDQLVPYSEYKAVLVYRLDGTVFSVEPGSVFDLKGRRFRVEDIDKRNDTVVIVNLADGKQLEVRKEPAG